MIFSFRGLCPWLPNQGFWTSLQGGARPQTTVLASRVLLPIPLLINPEFW